MTGVTFTVDVVGAAEAAAALRAIARRGGDLAPVLDLIGATLEDSTRVRFDPLVASAPDGTKWKKTVRSETEGGQILVDQGYLLASITHLVDGDEVKVGSNRPYGAFHQFGTRHIAARPFLGLSSEDETDIVEIAGRWLAAPAEGRR